MQAAEYLRATARRSTRNHVLNPALAMKFADALPIAIRGPASGVPRLAEPVAASRRILPIASVATIRPRTA